MTLSHIFLRPGECLAAVAILATSALSAAMAVVHQAPVDLPSYGGKALPVVLFLTTGAIARRWRRDEFLASFTMAAGLLLAFSLVLSTYNYLLLPVAVPLIDPWLLSTNAALGYDWIAFVDWAASYPLLSSALGSVYRSTLLQILAVLLALAVTRRFAVADLMVATIVVSGLATVAFWGLFPSIGVAPFLPLPETAQRAAALVVDGREGAALLRLVTLGPEVISPETMTGLIGFPSFHTVLACICVRFAWPIRWLRWPLLLLNAAMLPAILLHGGHHLLDLAGGAAFFVASLWTATRLTRLIGEHEPREIVTAMRRAQVSTACTKPPGAWSTDPAGNRGRSR